MEFLLIPCRKTDLNGRYLLIEEKTRVIRQQMQMDCRTNWEDVRGRRFFHPRQILLERVTFLSTSLYNLCLK